MIDTIYKNLGALIAKLQLNLSDIAAGLGITLATLKNKFLGKESINLDAACYIAKLLNSDAYYLFAELA